MHTLPTIGTQAQAIAYLTNSCGIKDNWAKAMVLEFYTFNHPTLLQTADSLEEDEAQTVVQSEEQVFNMYKDWLSYSITETAEGITFDGDLTYTLDGKRLY